VFGGEGGAHTAPNAAATTDARAGIAASTARTGQQWDWPNGWPPLQHMLIEGAAQHGGAAGRRFAARMAHTWLQ
jgi:alpha,alpha-trehalase